MVQILTAVMSDGLAAVEAACAEAVAANLHSADVILNILARRRETIVPITILPPTLCGCGCGMSMPPIAPATTA